MSAVPASAVPTSAVVREPRETRGTRLAWAGLLVAGSLLLLIYNLDLLRRFEPLSDYIVAGALALSGAAVFASLATSPQAWWRLIPGWTLIALAAMVLLARTGAGRWVAALLFAGLAVAFVNIYLLNRRDQWWALLPGGFLAVLGLVIGLSNSVASLELLGAVLLGGLGLVFLLLGAVGGPQSRYWAQIPGSILLLFGFFVLTLGADNANGEPAFWVRWWPLAPLLLGLLIGWRALATPPASERLVVNRAPSRTALRDATPSADDPPVQRQSLGEYTVPAPGASVQLLSDE
ncbi:MAG: hypothetical protein ACRC1H_06840 [Caldilineaceae bacterium]